MPSKLWPHVRFRQLAPMNSWLVLLGSVNYGRKAVSEAKSANAVASERSVVEWQVDRLDKSNAGRPGSFIRR